MIQVNANMDRVRELAVARAKKMVDNGLYSRFNLNRGDRIKKAELGCIGEMAFEHFLNQNEVAYEKDITGFSERNSDRFDFMANHKTIDVKVAKKTTDRAPQDNWTYGYPEEQNPITKDYIVVGWVDFKDEKIGFYGFTTGRFIASLPVVKTNGFAGYQYLTPNHEFKWGALEKDLGKLVKRLKV